MGYCFVKRCAGGSGEVKAQAKTVTPTKAKQTVLPDADHTHLSQVTVNAIPSKYIEPSGELEITANGAYDVTEKASVEVNVESGDSNADAIWRGLAEQTITDVTIPNGTAAIAQSAFYGNNFVNVTLPESVTSIGESAFQNCPSLESINLPSGLTEIGANAFNACKKLAITEIPSGVTKLMSYVFAYNAATEFTVHAGVTALYQGCINRAPNMKKVTFLGTPTTIHASAFSYCTAITDIYVPWAEGEVANAPWGATNATIHYGVGKEIVVYMANDQDETIKYALEGVKEGMTWREWIDATSGYVTENMGDGWIWIEDSGDGTDTLWCGSYAEIYNSNSELQTPDSVMVEGETYYSYEIIY